MRHSPKHSSGFSLIQICMVIAIASLMLAAVLPGGRMGSDADKRILTMQRMEKIEAALRTFMYKNKRLPCPADGSLRPGNSNFGKELGALHYYRYCASMSYDPGNDSNPFIDIPDSVAGVVPTRALGLPDEDMLDGWGRRIMYVVDYTSVSTATACTNDQKNA